MPISADVKCPFANTVAACPATPGVAFQLTLNLAKPLASALFAAPYNPFIFRSAQRGIEVHLPGQPPTALADASLFGSADDRSKPGTANTYMDAQRRPWALDIPAVWAWPLETTDLLKPYPRFADWATSAGATARDWYLSGTVPSSTYSAKP
jgi:LruC domain-containing protein